MRTCSVGPYELRRIVGKGAFAEVWEGIHVITNERFAVKVVRLRQKKSSTAEAMLLNEARILKCLSHPHVIQSHQVMRSSDALCLVLDFAPNGTLADRIQAAGGRLEERFVAKYCTQLANAFAYCHSMGVAHRDIKPENVMLDEHDNIKIIDFGLASASQSQQLIRRSHLWSNPAGSPCYMSPELFRQRQPVKFPDRADVWALGVLMFAALTGELPFHGNSSRDLALRTREKTPEIEAVVASTSSRDLVRRLLCRDPERRPSMAEVSNHVWGA